ncbi:MAG: hypothetical protein ACOY40_05435 [Bacillota bacterium]
MQTLLSVDVGSGSVKGVSGGGRKINFQSVLAPVREDELDGIFSSEGPGYRVAVKMEGENRSWLVGERALQSPLATLSLSCEKPPEFHDALLLTAAYLLNRSDGGESEAISLGIGVPLAVYKKERDSLKKRLLGFSAPVSVDGKEERTIAFSRVEVYPQGAGVVLYAMGSNVLQDGLTGVVDIGEYTTDILLIDVKDGKPIPLGDEYRASLTLGVHLVSKSVMAEFKRQTGTPLDLVESSTVTRKTLSGQSIVYGGKKYNLGAAVQRAVKDIETLITSSITNTWGAKAGFLENVLLAGGGAHLFGKALAEVLPNAKIVEEPVFANAIGYLKAIGSAKN